MNNNYKLNKTTLIEGKIESGKTTGIMFDEFKEMIDNNENILVIDSKEEYYQQFKNELDNKDYETIILNLKDVTKSNNYNPYTLPYYYYKNNNLDASIELIEKISKSIFFEDNSNGDPFWPQSAADLFVGLSLILLKEIKEEKYINMGELSILHDLVHKKYEDSNLIKMYLSNLNTLDPIYTSLSGTMYAPADTKGSILSVFKPKIKEYTLRPNLLSLLSSTNFDLINFGQKKTAIFVIPNDDIVEYNNIANIFIEQIIYLIKDKNLKFNLIFDNIDYIKHIDSLYSLLNIPSDILKVIVATRNLESLKEKYPKDTFSNILTNIKINDNKCIINNEEYNLNLVEKQNNDVKYPVTDNTFQVFDIENHLIDLLK